MAKDSCRSGNWKDTYRGKAIALLNQANPVSGTKYTVLDTTQNVAIEGIEVEVTWTVQPTPLEVWITRDGTTIKHSQVNPISATPYYCTHARSQALDGQGMTDTVLTDVRRGGILWEGRSIKVEAETTGGTVQNLTCRVFYKQK